MEDLLHSAHWTVMKIKLLFNILTTRGYLCQLEGNKHHIRGFEEQFSWEDHMQELNLERQASFVIWQWGEKNSSQDSPTKVRTCRTLPIILQALSEHMWCLNRPCSLMGMLNINQRFIKDINQTKKKRMLQLTRMQENKWNGWDHRIRGRDIITEAREESLWKEWLS